MKNCRVFNLIREGIGRETTQYAIEFVKHTYLLRVLPVLLDLISNNQLEEGIRQNKRIFKQNIFQIVFFVLHVWVHIFFERQTFRKESILFW
jgi:hypothetical protein